MQTQGELDRAVAVLSSERGKWIGFRGVSGMFQVTTDTFLGGKSVPDSDTFAGKLSLDLSENQQDSDKQSWVGFPWEITLTSDQND